MKTIYYTATSLDGFITDPNNSLEWLFQLEGEGEADYVQFIQRIGALAMGSTTYEWILDHEKLLDADSENKWPYSQPTWVFTTRSLPGVVGADIRFVQGDVRPIHEQMAAAADGKDIWLVGGGELVGQFWDRGLLDELIITIGSVTLGAGAPLLPRAITKPPLKLISVQQMGPGFAQLHYEVRKAR